MYLVYLDKLIIRIYKKLCPFTYLIAINIRNHEFVLITTEVIYWRLASSQ